MSETKKNRYEALLVLNIKGSEDSTREIIERIQGEFEKEGASVEQVQRMEKRQFSYAAGELNAGYYANFILQAEPHLIERFRNKFKLDADVYRQHYQKLPSARRSKKVAKEEAAS